MQALTSLQATANWDGIKEHRVQSVRNGMLDVAKHAHWLRLRLLMTGNHDWHDTLAALEACTPERVKAARAALLQECHLEALVEGNVSPRAAVAMVRCAPAKHTRSSSDPQASSYPHANAADTRARWVQVSASAAGR